ncbi:hypothetical protein [Parapedobacter indicus]|uniref:DUF4328 domain-containing protein n=1 Tax=Parapedobacter indicus TaxID=1477437 RepID=A0A1I3KBY7_9SPHI|nr:hypothetical protein [Parapedobacter indicus]PPL01772.1 hypothetical protein CLV26_105150 [Parapedobacter indicus]SFI69904.1 hypothetical protein SAMN05444682_105150 [Parapedobacter indicus]
MSIDLENLSPEMIQVAVAVFLIRVVIWVFYANTIRRTLLLVAPENRLMTPNQAWLLAVPFFNIYWNFTVASRLADSLTNEFYDRKIAEEENPGRAGGMWYAWLFLLTNIPLPPFILITIFLLSIIYFIVYWVKVSNFRNLLAEHEKFRNNS